MKRKLGRHFDETFTAMLLVLLWLYLDNSQVSVYRTIGPTLVLISALEQIINSKTKVDIGIHIFLISALEHILWIFVRTCKAVLTNTHDLCLINDKKNRQFSSATCHFHSHKNRTIA